MSSRTARATLLACQLGLFVSSSHALLACSSHNQELVEANGSANGGGGGGLRIEGAGGDTSACVGSDRDQDGYTVEQGDCADCDPAVNPGAFDLPDNEIDEDCSGKADDEASDCDSGLAVEGDALAAAKAIGICRQTVHDAVGKARTWGLISARYVFPDGSTVSLADAILVPCASSAPNEKSHGILAGFGANVKPRQGQLLTALSSGVARAGEQVGASDVDIFSGISPSSGLMCTRSEPPPGLPPPSYSTCGDIADDISARSKAYDGMALELVLRAPTNAYGFAFDFDFYTYEYTDYVCSGFNDAFAALLYSASPDVPADHNIAFDSGKNPICVNNAFVEVCDPYTYQGTRAGKPFSRVFSCASGTNELLGTGFEQTATADGHAATGWLQTRANILPGEEFTLRFAIWDTADEILDSTVLLDRFVWDAKPGLVQTARPIVK